MFGPWLILVATLSLGAAVSEQELRRQAHEAVAYLKNAQNHYKDMTIDQASRHVMDKVKTAADQVKKVNYIELGKAARSQLNDAMSKIRAISHAQKLFVAPSKSA